MKTPRQKTARSCSRLPCVYLPLPALLGLCASNFATAQDLPSLDVVAGKALFERNWVSAPASTAASDGLGPFFNARSCASCHQDGGRGTLPQALNFVTTDVVYGEFLQTRAVQGLRAEAQVKVSSEEQLKILEDGTEVVLHLPSYELSDLRYGALHNMPSARIAPALTGLHLLEHVSEQYLQTLADPEDSNGDGISGRVSKVRELATGMLVTGRFGWKAESYSLRMQVARALSLDMGLGTSLYPSAFGDCTVHQPDCLQMVGGNSPASSDPEVSDTVLDLLLAYLHSLAPAQQHEGISDRPAAGRESGREERIMAAAADKAAEASGTNPSGNSGDGAGLNGSRLFNNTGCSACHIPSLDAGESRIYPFTDLLLHDMGPGLAAEATESAEAAEWRTAPLWGLSSAQVYLHDGRAATLAEAILWHGGEASAAAKAYGQLTKAEREVLHSWLLGL